MSSQPTHVHAPARAGSPSTTALRGKAEEEVISLSERELSSSACNGYEGQLRALMSELRQLGVERVRECLLIGVIAMLKRSLAEYRSRSDVGVGWLVEVIRTGGPLAATKPRMSERERVLADRDWWLQGRKLP